MYRKAGVILWLQITAFLALMALLAGCGMVKVGLPNSTESASVQTGQQTLVLLRVTGNLDDGTRVGTFDHSSQVNNVNLGLSLYVPQGEVALIRPQRFLSPETKEQGWIYFMVKPGAHYLGIIGTCELSSRPGQIQCQNRLNRTRLWKIDIPKGTRLIYIGSMHLRCWSDLYAFHDPVCSGFNEDKMSVRNEENLARQLAASSLDKFGSIHTLLMKPYD